MTKYTTARLNVTALWHSVCKMRGTRHLSQGHHHHNSRRRTRCSSTEFQSIPDPVRGWPPHATHFCVPILLLMCLTEGMQVTCSPAFYASGWLRLCWASYFEALTILYYLRHSYSQVCELHDFSIMKNISLAYKCLCPKFLTYVW